MQLRDYLREHDIPVETMAKRLGVTSRALYYYCDGSRRPRWPLIARISKVTGGKVTAADWMDAAAPGNEFAAA